MIIRKVGENMYSPLNRKSRFIYQVALICGLCIGSTLTVGIIVSWLPILELDLDAQPGEGDGPLLVLLILGLVLSGGIGYSIGIFLAILFLVLLKQLSFEEAIRLMFKSKYPNHWLK